MREKTPRARILILAVFAAANGLLGTNSFAEEFCGATAAPTFDGWAMSGGQNVSSSLSFYRTSSWEELKAATESETVRYFLASGWQSFSMSYVDGPPNVSPARWTWTGVMPNGVPRSSSEWGGGQGDALLYYNQNMANCPTGYTLTWNGQFGCALANSNLANCKSKPKPDKNRGQCPGNGSATEGNPCNVITGNKFQREVDFEGPTESSLKFIRFYNSDSETPLAQLGAQWRHTYDRRLIFSTSTMFAHMHYGARAIYAWRDDGKTLPFAITGSAIAPRDSDIKEQLTQVDAGTWELRTTDDTVETYKINADHSGSAAYASLVSIRFRDGVTHLLTYASNTLLTSVTESFGNSISFTYDSQQRLASVTDPAGQSHTFQYNSSGLLSSVTRPGTPPRQYLYADSANPGALTSILDEAGNTFATWTYDSQRRATSSQHAGGAGLVNFSYGSNGSTTVTDAIGGSRTYLSSVIESRPRITSLLEGGATRSTSYDSSGYTQSTTNKNGVQTTYTYDTRGLETSRTEAYGTPRARTISTTWHPTLRLPTQIDEPGKRTTFTYDSNGNILTKTILDTASSISRVWTFTYNSYGQVLTIDGPRTDVSDVTTYTYYACTAGYQCSRLHTVTNAQNQVTTFNTYNANGQPLTITNPNGVVTTLTYDGRMRLTSRSVAGETTSFEYWPTGVLKKVTLPDGSFLSYAYDNAHRLTQVSDSEGNKVVYTLDAMGNRTTENIYDPSNLLTNTRTRVFNTLNRLYQETAAAGTSGVTTTFGYDNQGNPTSISAPLSRVSTSQYDELDRLKQTTDALSGVTQYAYNALDQLISVTDPRNKVTSYTYNALGDLLTQVSPDTGTTTNTYDSGGNLKTKTDARGALVTYSYDALNRVTQAVTSDQTIAYHYDVGTNGKGRLSDLSDNSGSTSFTYDAQGRVTSKTQVMAGISKTVSYSFDSSGRLATLTTPTGNVVTYGYTNGKVTSLTLNGSTTVLSSILYEPFGPIRQWTWGNSTLTNRTFDQDGKITAIESAGQVTVTYDNAFRITHLIDTANSNLSQTLDYDLLDRLTSATGTNLNQSFTYDANGNRLTQGGSSSSTFTISSTSNRLNSVSGALTRTYSYDNAGNTTSDGAATFTFDQQGRMATSTKSSVVTSYSYNALGQRVRKSNSATTRYFVYDELGHLLGEYDGGGALVQELVWLGDIPVATIRANENGSGIGVFYIHTDHLNTPRKITRPNDNAIVWRWDSDPFGNELPNEDADGNGLFVEFNLRFPGQYFDAETGLNYNYFRNYDPQTGRYTTSDPIGLDGGINSYAYVGGNALSYSDPFGLAEIPNPNGTVPGGPWTPAGPGQRPGSFYGPEQPSGPRSQCEYVPDENNGGPRGAKEPYWKVKQPGQDGWQRFDPRGKPITPEEAHPGSRGPADPEPSSPPPGTSLLARFLIGLGLLFHSEPAY